MTVKLKNNVSATLASSIGVSDVGLVVTTGQGVRFPTLTSGEYFYGTLVDPSGVIEVVKVTARSADVMTIVRAQEGTSAASFAAGSRIEMRITAQSVIDAATDIATSGILSSAYIDFSEQVSVPTPGADVARVFSIDSSGGTKLAVKNNSGTTSVFLTTSSSPTSVDGEVALYSGTTGTEFKRATTTGVLKATSGVLAAATAGTDYLAPAAIGTTVQAYSAGLTDIAGLARTDGNIIVGDGTNWVAESGATARTSLGLGSLATLSSINDGNWSGTDLAVANGGTGASDASTARTNLGLGTIATQAANNVTITGGSISGITDLAVADGGTGASDASTARTNLGVAIGTNVQAYDPTLSALAAYSTNGLVTQTASDTFTGRTVTGTTNQITVTNGDGVAGNPTLSLPADVVIPTVITAPNTGLHILDTNASHDLIVKPGSDLTADRTFTLTTGDADRTLNISAADVTISTAGAALIDDADAAAQRTTLGLGTIATQNASNVAITGGTISGITDLAVADGGTGASTAITASRALGVPYILAASAVASSHTGSTAATTLATITVPGNSIGPNGQLRITTLGSCTSSANTKRLRVLFGGSAYTSIAQTTAISQQYITIVRNRNSASSQVGAPSNFVGVGAATGALITSTVDTTVDQDVIISGELADGTDTITLESYTIEIIYKA